MPKSSAERSANYDAKLSPDITKIRIDAQRENMVSNATTAFGDLEAIENAAQSYLSSANDGASPPQSIPTIDFPAYYAYVRKLYKLSYKYSGLALAKEASIFGQTYSTRGYNDAVLVGLADVIFGITITLV